MTGIVPPSSGAIQSTAGGLSTDTSRLKSADNLKKAGERFEAVFTGMMLKSMRQTHLAEPLFDSKAIDTFTDMQDQRLAQSMAEHAPIGIGTAMTAFLANAQPDLKPQADVNTSVADPPAS